VNIGKGSNVTVAWVGLSIWFFSLLVLPNSMASCPPLPVFEMNENG
jgi:hypothetical protein